jgi:hypothetical protein
LSSKESWLPSAAASPFISLEVLFRPFDAIVTEAVLGLLYEVFVLDPGPAVLASNDELFAFTAELFVHPLMLFVPFLAPFFNRSSMPFATGGLEL